MRVLYVTSSLPFGPGEAFLIPEIRELIHQGHRVIVVPVFPRGQVLHQDARSLLKIVRAEHVISVRVLAWALVAFLKYPLRAIMCFVLILKSRNIKILLKNLAIYPKALWLAVHAMKWKVDHIHAHWASTSATMAMIASMVSGIPWSFTAHRWDICENNLMSVKINRAVFARFISKSGVKLLRQFCGKVNERKVKVIPMGVDVVRNDERNGMDSRDLVSHTVLCPANMIVVKGHIYLLRAFGILKERGIPVRLWLAGDGKLRRRLEIEADELGITDTVVFLGQVSHSRLLQFYRNRQISMVVLPSIDMGNGVQEGIPVSLMEAMNYGVPVISTRTGGIPELLEDGAGLIVPPRDPQALADAIALLAESADLRTKLGKAGRKVIEQKHDVQKIVRKITDMFQNTHV